MAEKKTVEQEILARLTKSKTDQGLANQIGRKINAALKGQVSSLESEEIDAENSLEDAKEALENAKYPTILPSSPGSYINSVKIARDAVVEAEETLKDIKDSIIYYTSIKDSN